MMVVFLLFFNCQKWHLRKTFEFLSSSSSAHCLVELILLYVWFFLKNWIENWMEHVQDLKFANWFQIFKKNIDEDGKERVSWINRKTMGVNFVERSVKWGEKDVFSIKKWRCKTFSIIIHFFILFVYLNTLGGMKNNAQNFWSKITFFLDILCVRCFFTLVTLISFFVMNFYFQKLWLLWL